MSNDTDYELEFSHGDKKYLTEAINWLGKKEPSWGFDIVVKPRKMTGELLLCKSNNLGENASNMTIEDEINELHKVYSEIEVDGTFEEEYGKGSFCGEKDYDEYWDDEEDYDE